MESHPLHLNAPLKFLIVDDSRAMQAIVRRAILNCGYEPVEIATAIDGQAALDMVEQFAPHLVITDWHMPKVSGLELLQALRQMGHQHVRVGFVTTEKNPALLNEARVNGALFTLNKPFNDPDLVQAVTSAIEDIIQERQGEGHSGTSTLPPPEAQTAAEPAPPTVAAPTAPTAPALAPGATSEPVPPAALQTLLSQCLGQIPFRLIAHERMTLEKLTPNNFLGLYGAASAKGVYAIVILDTHAICMVGGGMGRRPPTEVRPAMASGKPDDAMLSKAQEFARLSAQCLTATAAPGTEVNLAKTSIVKSNFAKLAEVLAQPNHRSDYRLSIPGYGEGRLAFFVMQP